MKSEVDSERRGPVVVVYQPAIFEVSETFIKEQFVSLSQWSGVALAERYVAEGPSRENIESRLLLGRNPNAVSRIAFRTCQFFGWVYTPALKNIAALRPALIHAHFGTAGVDIFPYAKKLGIPLLITLHGLDINAKKEWWQSGAGGRRRKRYPRTLLKVAGDNLVKFIAVSKAIKRTAEDFGIAGEKIFTHYIGIDLNRFDLPSIRVERNLKRVLFVGRLVEKKGVSFLIEAFARVSKTIPDAELVVVGDGPLLDYLKKYAEDLDVRVKFLGSLSHDAVITEMHRSAVLCLPSVTAKNGDAEGLGMVLIEAQACGTPVVSSAKGGSSEALIDGVTGFAFAEGDVGRMASLISEIISNEDIFNRLSLEAKKFARKFDISSQAEQLENLYFEAVARCGRSS